MGKKQAQRAHGAPPAKDAPEPRKNPSHVSTSPVNPPSKRVEMPRFEVEQIFDGSASTVAAGAPAAAIDAAVGPDEKARKAYFWIVNNAIISPYYDIEFNSSRAPVEIRFTGVGSKLTLPTDQSYSSFVLLPLLNFLVRKRALFIGGPGRGKTASALLMGLLAGYSMKEVKQAVQHGQPQMTISDLLGNPLPRDLLNAKQMEEVKIAWRKWIDMRIKIVDEYNRIPTRTQSALLTLLADGYAEVLDQVVECGESAWFLTANDDLGGGTYQVIEALKDRLDIVVIALNFNSFFLDDLLYRVETGQKPENLVPRDIVFTPEELDRAFKDIMSIPIPKPVLRRLEFFTAQFDFCDLAADTLEYKSKDVIRLAGKTLSEVCRNDCGRDKVKNLCSQTQNGISVRGRLTIINFAKAMAYFRGNAEVDLDDLRQIVPWLLREKLFPNLESPAFEAAQLLSLDRIAWIRKLWDDSLELYERLDWDNADPLISIEREFNQGLDGLATAEVNRRLATIENAIAKLAKDSKLLAYVYDTALRLKYFHQRYSNYLKWLEFRG
ncbi:MAG: AAA family ATPase [Candidatus Lokiarchaeota archaeon]|nr:AAA family ATPase [Candidatus Lokiarchaeota archaeon]